MPKPDPYAEPGGEKTEPEYWLSRHGDALYRFAYARVRRREVAEDLVQEALVAAWRGRGEFAGQAAERTWLTAILKRKVIDWLRVQVREQQPAPDESEGTIADLFDARGKWKTPPVRWTHDDPADLAERQEFWTVMTACAGKLSSRLRNVFTLRYLDDAAADAICQQVGLTPTNLWVTLHRARLQVWQCLSRNWFGTTAKRGAV